MLNEKERRMVEQLKAQDSEFSRLLKALEEERHEIISMISHELRNPLTLVNSSLQLIERAHPEVTDFRLWHQVQEDIDYMKQLLNDLSCFNNASSLSLERMDLNELAASCIRSFRPEFQKRGMHLIFHPCKELPPIYGDKIKLKEVLFNLLKNSMEAMQADGTAKVSLSLRSSQAFLSVSDSGCGISPEHAEEIFLPFKTFKPQGTGLGLSLSRQIAFAHGGDLTFQNRPGSGAVFTLTLPAVAP